MVDEVFFPLPFNIFLFTNLFSCAYSNKLSTIHNFLTLYLPSIMKCPIMSYMCYILHSLKIFSLFPLLSLKQLLASIQIWILLKFSPLLITTDDFLIDLRAPLSSCACIFKASIKILQLNFCGCCFKPFSSSKASVKTSVRSFVIVKTYSLFIKI